MRQLICAAVLLLLAPPGLAQREAPSVSAVAEPATPSMQAHGMVQFALSPAGAGDYYGWKFAIVQAARNKGLVPQSSREMQSGQQAFYQLWPDRYLVRVLRRGDLKFQAWIDVRAEHLTRVHVDIGMFSSDVMVDPAREAGAMLRELRKYPGLAEPPERSYRPYTVFDQDGLQVQYDGPQDAGEWRDGGTLRISWQGVAVATVSGAQFGPGHVTGALQFVDGRTVVPDGVLGSDYQLAEGSRSTWPDGTVFTGRYRGLQPVQGELLLPDGSHWSGAVSQRRPSGPGRITRADGSWVEVPSGERMARLSGTFPCGGVAVEPGTCDYLAGQPVDSAQQAERSIARQAALAPPAVPGLPASVAGRLPPPPPPRSAASVPAPVGRGCGQASGAFTSDDGDTLWTLQQPGRGSGHFRQFSRGGATRYQFDIDVHYETTGDSIRLRYGQGIYRERDSGKILQRTSIPGGTVRCDFDGSRLVIEGKVFRRQ